VGRRAAAVVLLLSAVAGCGGDERPEPPDARPRVTASVVVGQGGFGLEGIAVGEGAVWAAGGQFLDRIDPARNEVSDRLRLDAWAHDVAAGEGAVWLAGAHHVLRVDPDSVTVEKRIALPDPHWPSGIAVGFGSVWVSVSHGASRGEVVRIDAAKGEVVARIPTRGYAGELETGAGAVWVMGHPSYTNGARGRGTTMHRIDFRTNRLETVMREPGVELGASLFPKVLATGDEEVWVQAWNPDYPYGGEALRVDAETGEVRRHRLGIKRFFPFAVAEGGVWFHGPKGGIARLDPRTLRVDSELDIEFHIVDADHDAERRAFWIATTLVKRGQRNHAIRVDVD
jgi:hypothetical protein